MLNGTSVWQAPKLLHGLVAHKKQPDKTSGTPATGLVLEWKREMKRLHGVEFDDLYSITNMPISRFLQWLSASGNLTGYTQRLVDAFNPTAAEGVMCRTTLSVGWDGRLYDCDFNQMLDLEIGFDAPRHLAGFELSL